MSLSVSSITFDAMRADRLAAFWAAALGGVVQADASEHFAVVSGGFGRMMFIQVPEGKQAKNRMHLDLEAETSVADEVERLLALGATKVADMDEWNFQWTVMADPEGNEFCVAFHAEP